MQRVAEVLARRDNNEIRLVITGAGGWLGREMMDLLLQAWGDSAVERILPLAQTPRTIQLASGHEIELQSHEDSDVAAFMPTHVVHLAFLTRDRIGQGPIEEYIATNARLSCEATELLCIPSVKGIMFTSSGAALAAPTGTDFDRYGQLKRDDEERIPRFATERGKGCVTARVWSVSGANIQKVDTFAFSSLVAQALRGGPLYVQASHPVFRRYVDAGEFLGLGLLELLDDERIVIDSAGERVEVGELALRVAAKLSPGAGVVRGSATNDRVDDYTADPRSMDTCATRHGVALRNLDEQIASTANGIRRFSRSRTNTEWPPEAITGDVTARRSAAF